MNWMSQRPQEIQEEGEPEGEPLEDEEVMKTQSHDVGGVIDMLFEIHSALKTKHLGQRTAASALAASNLVTTVAFPNKEPVPRDEQMEALENARRMLECAICQDIFTEATEASCCGQIFCRLCIERWVNDRGSCPMCRDEVSFSMLMPSRHAQRMANEMTTHCQWCEESMKKAALKDHLLACDQAPVEPPAPADVMLRRSLLEAARMESLRFRAFLLSPAHPDAEMTQCYIQASNGNYKLYTLEGDVLLCTAVRRRQLDMSVTFVVNMATGTLQEDAQENISAAEAQVGRLERNFVGSQYTIFNTDSSNTSREVGAVQYAATFGKTPRQMRVAVPVVAQVEDSWVHETTEGESMLSQIERPDPSRAVNLINKPPVWIESLEAYCLDFGGRVAAASVKNFLLTKPDEMDKTMMLFGRTADRNVYSMDFRHPLSPVQAFSIALSSMDSHLVTFD